MPAGINTLSSICIGLSIYFQIMQKDREIEEWKDKFTGMKESHNSLKGKLDGLERYISDLPAPEELNKNAEDISFYQ